jgi:2,4-dienoyl-CoA reductase-like NADH-dependent reductase (Old Yellow Enzyme family)
VLRNPLQIGGTTVVRNRLYRAPVLEGAGDGDDCAELYAKAFVPNARAGVGLVIQGNSCISAEGRSSPGMTLVHTRERMLRLAPMVDRVHAEGASIWIQIGHAGLFAMEAWHQPYAARRRDPLLAPSPPRWYLRPVFRRAPVHAMATGEVHAMCARYGEVAAWAREAGYDGVQLASSNAKLIDQFLSPFYNRRTDEFGGSPEGRARILQSIRANIAERAGSDFTCTVKIPIDEKAPPFTARTSWDDGLRLARLCEEWGYDAITPVHVSVLPDTTLSRGGIPSSLWRNPAMKKRLSNAATTRFERAVLMAGYVGGGVASPFVPVWNRSRFRAAKPLVSIPVFAVGGIRTRAEVEQIVGDGEADMVGIGRPFYAEPDLARRIIGDVDPTAHARDAHDTGLCRNSNLCVPAQMLGMKGVCYNPEVVKLRRAGT